LSIEKAMSFAYLSALMEYLIWADNIPDGGNKHKELKKEFEFLKEEMAK
jgi:hypothetical protein